MKVYVMPATNCCPQHVTGLLWPWCSAPQPVSLFPPLAVSLSSGMLNLHDQMSAFWRYHRGPQLVPSRGLLVMIKEVQTAERNVLLFKHGRIHKIEACTSVI